MGSLFGGGAKNAYYAASTAQQGALQQAAANREAAIAGSELSMINQITPNGNLTYAQTGTSANNNPIYTATQTYDPITQQTIDAQKQADLKTNNLGVQQIDRASGILGQNADYSEGAIQSKIRAMNDPRLDETFGRERQRQAEGLIARGVREGSQAWKDAFTEFDRRENDARTSSYLQSRGQALNEIPAGRNQALNEIAALLGTQQIQSPNFVSTPQARVNPADFQGAAAQQIQAFNGIQQQKQANAGGLFGLIGKGIGAGATLLARSDIRIKADVKRIGALDNGLPFYAFRYIGGGGQHFGLMAQDVEQVLPEAVHDIGGIKMVDYEMAAGWGGA